MKIAINMFDGLNLKRVLCVLAVLFTFSILLFGPAIPKAIAVVDPSELHVEGIAYNRDVDGAVATRPNEIMWDIAVDFNVNVTLPVEGEDDSFIQRNLDRVNLYKADGNEVRGWHASVDAGDMCVIYIELDEWLEPLAEYQVVVDAGLEAAESDDVLANEYREFFTTGALCSNGLTAYQNAWIALAGLVIAIGIVCQVIRVKRKRR